MIIEKLKALLQSYAGTNDLAPLAAGVVRANMFNEECGFAGNWRGDCSSDCSSDYDDDDDCGDCDYGDDTNDCVYIDCDDY